MIHSQLVKDKTVVPIGFKYFIAPILATIFILPLFAFSINLIVGKNDSFGFDDSSFKRKLLFVLMAFQFIPLLVSVAFMMAETVPEGHSQYLVIEQLIANVFLLFSALTLKFGNYQKDDDSFQ